MIEIYNGFFVNPWKVTVVKAIDTDKCILYVSGQSALDGFVVDKNALEVATDIVEAMNEDEMDEEDEKEE
jgi:hypothetical protein